MSAAGTILAILGTLLVPFAAYGFVFLVAHLEHRAAIRARLKLVNEALSNRANGDHLALPDNFKFTSHGRESAK